MNRRHMVQILAVMALSPTAIATKGAAQSDKREVISSAAGVQATVAPDGVVRIAWSRTDVPVIVDGAPLAPAAGLGSWAAFKAHGEDHVMLMGDTVVFEDEITAAMDAAFAAGLQVTGLHNHFIFDDPPVYFMHIGGMGPAHDLATGVKAVWDAIRAVRAETPTPRRRFPGSTPTVAGEFDVASLRRYFEVDPELNGGVVKFTLPRTGRMHGVEVGGSMGLTTWAAFSGSTAMATVAGDFIMTAEEVQPVLRSLRAGDIHVVALHNHMIGETPAFYFVHYWGKGPAEDLAQGVNAALAVQKGS